MESAQHKQIARRLARKFGTPYRPERRGPDIQTPEKVVEVGTNPARVQEEMAQVRRSTKVPYVAGPPQFVQAALKATHGTGIGVIDQHGNIVKRGSRPRGKR